jgi:hypothetical protein
MMPDHVSVEAAVLVEATDEVPAIVPNPFEERFGGIPGIKQHVSRATAQAIAGIAESR